MSSNSLDDLTLMRKVDDDRCVSAFIVSIRALRSIVPFIALGLAGILARCGSSSAGEFGTVNVSGVLQGTLQISSRRTANPTPELAAGEFPNALEPSLLRSI